MDLNVKKALGIGQAWGRLMERKKAGEGLCGSMSITRLELRAPVPPFESSVTKSETEAETKGNSQY